jgi:hypothetical protein
LKTPLLARLNAALQLVLLACSSVALGAYLYVALSRLTYPFGLEWLEANNIIFIERIFQRLPLYLAPSYRFIPILYTPLYYYVSAAVAALTHQSLVSLRLVSILSSGLLFGLIYGLCRGRQLSRQASYLAVGLFAASYGVTGYWLDLGRVDTLFLALLLATFLLVRSRTPQDGISGVAAGLVLCADFFTKQQALIAFPFLLLYLLLERRWEKLLGFGLTFTATTLGLFWAANQASQGWLWFFTVLMPSAEPVSRELLASYWTRYFFPDFPWLLVLLVLSAIVIASQPRLKPIWMNLLQLLILMAPLMGISLLTLGREWGYLNGLLPAAIALAVTAAEAYHHLATGSYPNERVKVGLTALASLLIFMQFMSFRYDPRAQIPSAEQEAAGHKIIQLLENSPTPIFIPTAPYLLSMIGQPDHFQVVSLQDIVLAAENNPQVMQIYLEYKQAIEGPITDGSIRTAVLPNVNLYKKFFSPINNYSCQSLVFGGQALKPVTGAFNYPDIICIQEP